MIFLLPQTPRFVDAPTQAMWRDVANALREEGFAYGRSPDEQIPSGRWGGISFHEPGSKLRGRVRQYDGYQDDLPLTQAILRFPYGDREATLPFTSKYRFTRSMAGVSGQALADRIEVEVEIESGGPLPPRPGMKVPASFADAYFPKVEAILRASLAIFARRGASVGAFAVGVAPAVPGLVKGNDVYSRADRLPGVAAEHDRSRFFWRFKKGGRELLLPIGSDQARVNGDWRDVGRVLPMKDGSLYVPIGLARWIAAG